MRSTSMRKGRRPLATVVAVMTVGMLAACGDSADDGDSTTEDSGEESADASDEESGGDAWLDELEPRVLKLADFSGPQDANFGIAMTEWEEEITEFTDGKITFENYWSASLLGATDSLQGVGDGVADIGQVIPSYQPQELPVTSWLFGMGNALTGSTVHDVAAGGATAHETILTIDAVTEEYASHNVKVLNGSSTPAYNMLCNTPVSSLDEAEGKRVRVSGPVWSETVEALGMTPVSIAWDEVYEALQREVIDCMTINPNQLADGLILKDVAPEYVPVTTAQLQSSTFVMNLDTWESFPPELQDFITEANARAAYKIWQGYLEIEAAAGDLIASGEVNTNEVSELEPVATTQREEAIAAMADNAPAAIEDPQAMVDQYLERTQYWQQVLVDQGYPIVERNPEAIIEAFAGLRDVDLSDFFAKYEEEVVPTLKEQ